MFLPKRPIEILIFGTSLFAAFLLFSLPGLAQKIAIIAPENTLISDNFSLKLSRSFPERFKILDSALTKTAFSSITFKNPYNLSDEESRLTGSVVGADFFLVVQTKTLRRYSFERKQYYEAYAAVFTVSSRSGHLIDWRLLNGEAESPDIAEAALESKSTIAAKEISEIIAKVYAKEVDEKPVKSDGSTDLENEKSDFRPPLPYRRIKPDYTVIANLYAVEATVDILVDIDESGTVTRTRISRWAGFGLDESVKEAVLKMNWRPADRSGKRIATQVLLRYNFKKPEKEQN